MPPREIERLRHAAQEAVGIAGHRPDGGPVGELASALEELRIHGAELEIQNEELRTSRAELERSQKRYFRHFDLAPVGMLRLDRHGMILEANILGTKMLGFERARLGAMKLPFSPMLTSASQGIFHSHLQKALASREMESCEVKLRRQAGKETAVRLQSVASVGHDDALDLLVTLTDLMEREQAEAARLGLERLLFEARGLENIGMIAGGIAHDLNNILHVILGNLELALQVPASEPMRQMLDEADRAARRGTRVSNRFLTFSKGGCPVKQTIDVSEILGPAVVLALSGSPLKSVFEIQPDLPPIQVDPGQFAQVIENVALNAREATAGAGTLVTRVDTVRLAHSEAGGLPAGDYVRIAFQDHGVGIPEEVQGRIFDVCFTTKPRGCGIGLASAKSIVEQHGGAIQVHSRTGHGSTVTLLVPAGERSAVPPATPRAPIKMGSGRILLVDDEESIRSVVPMLLAKLGYRCVVACDGAEGCTAYVRAKVEGHPFAAVLLDATIPGGLGGEAALRLLLAADPEARVILSSGYADSEVMEHALRLGFKGRLPKPFDLRDLAEVLSEVVA